MYKKVRIQAIKKYISAAKKWCYDIRKTAFVRVDIAQREQGCSLQTFELTV